MLEFEPKLLRKLEALGKWKAGGGPALSSADFKDIGEEINLKLPRFAEIIVIYGPLDPGHANSLPLGSIDGDLLVFCIATTQHARWYASHTRISIQQYMEERHAKMKLRESGGTHVQARLKYKFELFEKVLLVCHCPTNSSFVLISSDVTLGRIAQGRELDYGPRLDQRWRDAVDHPG